ncbi:hypothetical protein ACSQ67_008694 [Phaseolus vulgaris]
MYVLPFVFPVELLILNHAVQDPLRGGNDYLFDHAVAIIHSNDSDALTKDVFAPRRKRFVPEILLKLASKISPF